MNITIRASNIAPASLTARALRLTKPTIDLDTAPYIILISRVSLGLLFLAHGLLKLFVFTLPNVVQFFQSLTQLARCSAVNVIEEDL